MSFKDEHRELQELVRELGRLRAHNMQFKEGDPQDKILLFAEGALVLIALERFLRMILGPTESTDSDTLRPLLEKATGARLNLLKLPGNRDELLTKVALVRNTILHGNYEQIARHVGCATVGEFFKTKYILIVEELYQLTDRFVKQIDPETGRAISGAQ